jgi:hypothetical protein
VQSRPQVNEDFHFAVSVYEADADAVRRFAKAYGVKSLFVLQPMIFTKSPLSKFERTVMAEVVEPNKPHLEYMRHWYLEAQNVMRGYDDFADLTRVLDGRQISDFFDHGHTGPEASEPIGIALGREAEKRLRRK